MKNKPTHYGILLAAITLLIFFAVYYFFIGFDYYTISVKVNAFVLPAIYTLVTVILLYKKTNLKKLSFSESFQNAFFTMFIGGTISFLFIAFFFNYVDKDAQTLLQHQRLEKSLEGIHHEYRTIKKPTKEEIIHYKELIKTINSDEVRNDPLFNWKKSLGILGVLYLFYLIISLFLSIFFRLRNPHATLHSNSSTQRN